MSVQSPMYQRLPIEAYLAHGASAGLRWTELRERLLRLIWSVSAPLGAYEAAERLSARGRSAHPTSVYRWLQCFERAGLVLKIVSWNRFLLSPNPTVPLWGLLLCRSCRSCAVIDLTPESDPLDRMLAERSFSQSRRCVECEGRCQACQSMEEAECDT